MPSTSEPSLDTSASICTCPCASIEGLTATMRPLTSLCRSAKGLTAISCPGRSSPTSDSSTVKRTLSRVSSSSVQNSPADFS